MAGCSSTRRSRWSQLSFTNAPLIGAGKWIGLDNYSALFNDQIFRTAIWNTSYFVLLTVVPGTAAALGIALMVSRLSGWLQSLILAASSCPTSCRSRSSTCIWQWLCNVQFGILQYVIAPIVGQPVNVWRTPPVVHAVGRAVTIWWTNGFSILLFLAGLRNIPTEIYEAAELDGATRWQIFRADHLAADLAGDGALPHDPADPAAQDIRSGLPVFASADARRRRWCWCSTSTSRRSSTTMAAMRATIAVSLFVIVVAFSVLQFQVLRATRRAMNARARRAVDERRAQAHRSISAARLLTILTVICACVWFFPLYWALVTSLRTEDEIDQELQPVARASDARGLHLHHRQLEIRRSGI